MSLLGRGAVVIWHGIRPEGLSEFYGWHNREHMLERVSVPGFNRGRRYVSVDDPMSFFNLYEVDGPAVLSGGAYLERLAAPTEWTRRAVPHFTGVARSLTQVVFSTGLGEAGCILTIRCDPEDPAILAGRVAEAGRRAIAERPEIVGIHVCRADIAASSVETAEARARGSSTDVPAVAILVEGTDPAPLSALSEGPFSDAALGLAAPGRRGLYRHQLTLTAGDAAAPN